MAFQSQLQLAVLDQGDSLLAKVDNAIEPIQYNWSTGEQFKSIKRPINGAYFLNIIDAVGCQELFEFKIPFYAEIDTTKEDIVQEISHLDKGESVALKHLLFNYNSEILNSVSYAELDKLCSFLKLHTTYKIEIGGYTDNVGEQQYNQKLSEKRAKSVIEYLINCGIEKERLVAMGYGEMYPIASNITVSGRKLNRRVVLKIIDK
jgi:outer membrane protein OmpA-like peptidoglycan-associated protein